MQFPDYKPAPVKNLVPYARNSRTHSAAQVDKIAASIKESGKTYAELSNVTQAA